MWASQVDDGALKLLVKEGGRQTAGESVANINCNHINHMSLTILSSLGLPKNSKLRYLMNLLNLIKN